AGIEVVRDAAVRFRPRVPQAGNGAKQLAAALHERVAVIYGAGFLAAVARRWKGQCNENGKHWAFFEELPELDHNAVVGYQFPATAPDALRIVLLCSTLLPRRI